MFGLFKKKPSNDDLVVALAIELLGILIPTAKVDRDGLVLHVSHGRGFQLDVSVYVGLANVGIEWMRALRSHVFAVLDDAEKVKPDEIQHAVQLLPFDELPDDLRDSDLWAVEPVAGNLWAMYGEQAEDGFAVMEWEALIADDRHHLVRWMAAVRTLNRGAGGDFTREHISTEMIPGVPVFTNGEYHPQIGAALLMPPSFWQGVMEAHGTDTILIAVPAPSRLFWSPRAELLEPMRALVANAVEVEEVTLSQEIYRFDGTAWQVAGSERARA